MKKVIQALCAFIIIVGVSITGGTKANAYSTYHDDYYDALHIKADHGRLSATSLGIGYPGDKYTADCAAMKGDSVALPGTTKSSSWWLSNRDQKTKIKRYSSLAYMIPPGQTTITLPNDCYIDQKNDNCWFEGKAN
jgi:hypothetical protein